LESEKSFMKSSASHFVLIVQVSTRN
jgi:hypothetical protein